MNLGGEFTSDLGWVSEGRRFMEGPLLQVTGPSSEGGGIIEH